MDRKGDRKIVGLIERANRRIDRETERQRAKRQRDREIDRQRD
jgi:hypothetical protein